MGSDGDEYDLGTGDGMNEDGEEVKDVMDDKDIDDL